MIAASPEVGRRRGTSKRETPDLHARREAAQRGDAEIHGILRRTSENAAKLRDWLHYDKEMRRVSDVSTAAIAAFTDALAREQAERLKVLEEQMSLHFDIQILEDEQSRRAGRPTLAESAAVALVESGAAGVDASAIATMLDTLARVPGRPPTDVAMVQYRATVASVVTLAEEIFSHMTDSLEVIRIREAKGHVASGTASGAEPRLGANRELIEKDVRRMSELAMRLQAERQGLRERRGKLMGDLGMIDAD